MKKHLHTHTSVHQKLFSKWSNLKVCCTFMISKRDELPRQKTRKEKVAQDSADILILAVNFNLQNFGKRREQNNPQPHVLAFVLKKNWTRHFLNYITRSRSRQKKEDEKEKIGYWQSAGYTRGIWNIKSTIFAWTKLEHATNSNELLLAVVSSHKITIIADQKRNAFKYNNVFGTSGGDHNQPRDSNPTWSVNWSNFNWTF